MNSKIKQQIKIPKKVENLLVKSGMKYELIEHRTVYTAFDKAATLKIKPGAIAKVLVVKADRELAMAVIGGDRNLDMGKLLKLTKAKKIDFAKEKNIGETFKGIDPGAIPPFEKLWDLKIFCDKKLLESPKIILSAGSYETSIKITPAAFKKSNPDMISNNFSLVRKKSPKKAKIKKDKIGIKINKKTKSRKTV
ncbi:MAG: YbaK/EbsC family protein [Candidatus Paceibacterota bacterium]